MLVTVKSLEKQNVRMKMVLHGHGDGFFVYEYQCIEYPRLRRVDKYIAKTRKIETTFVTDGELMNSMEEAVEALNKPPVITEEEKALLEKVSTEWTPVHGHEIGYLLLRELSLKDLVRVNDGKVKKMV